MVISVVRNMLNNILQALTPHKFWNQELTMKHKNSNIEEGKYDDYSLY